MLRTRSTQGNPQPMQVHELTESLARCERERAAEARTSDQATASRATPLLQQDGSCASCKHSYNEYKLEGAPSAVACAFVAAVEAEISQARELIARMQPVCICSAGGCQLRGELGESEQRIARLDAQLQSVSCERVRECARVFSCAQCSNSATPLGLACCLEHDKGTANNRDKHTNHAISVRIVAIRVRIVAIRA
jgi:hypothetical protein